MPQVESPPVSWSYRLTSGFPLASFISLSFLGEFYQAAGPETWLERMWTLAGPILVDSKLLATGHGHALSSGGQSL